MLNVCFGQVPEEVQGVHMWIVRPQLQSGLYPTKHNEMGYFARIPAL